MTVDWLQQAKANMVIDVDEVAVDRFDENFHDVEEWDHYLCDMKIKDFEESVEDNMRPCSECFPVLNAFWKAHWKYKKQG